MNTLYVYLHGKANQYVAVSSNENATTIRTLFNLGEAQF